MHAGEDTEQIEAMGADVGDRPGRDARRRVLGPAQGMH